MVNKRTTRILKEIEESGELVTYLLFQGVNLELLCACVDPECPECLINDQLFFSEKKVREAKEWIKKQ